eukprot:2215411-Rhodomonas_salina.1
MDDSKAANALLHHWKQIGQGTRNEILVGGVPEPASCLEGRNMASYAAHPTLWTSAAGPGTGSTSIFNNAERKPEYAVPSAS